MKKFLALLLSLVLCVSMCACNKKADTPQNPSEEPASNSTPDTSAKEPAATPEETKPGVSDEEFAKIEKMANEDSFEIDLEKQFMQENAYGSSFSIDGNDAYCVTVKNNSGKKVTEVGLYAVALKDNKWSRISNATVDLFANTSILKLSSVDLSLASGDSKNIGIRCSASSFDKAVAFVSSYTTEDGVVHENPNAEKWVNLIIESEKI